MRVRFRAAAVAALAAGLFSTTYASGESPASGTGPPWPTAGWEVATPESVGLDSARLARAVRRIRDAVPNTHAVFLEVNGRAILDAAFYPYDGQETHNLASVTKSVITTLIAIAADRGKLSLDQPMLDFFPGREIAVAAGRGVGRSPDRRGRLGQGVVQPAGHDERLLGRRLRLRLVDHDR
jgi:CubicO group peptidase (beta-lactamase class C family)